MSNKKVRSATSNKLVQCEECEYCIMPNTSQSVVDALIKEFPDLVGLCCKGPFQASEVAFKCTNATIHKPKFLAMSKEMGCFEGKQMSKKELLARKLAEK